MPEFIPEEPQEKKEKTKKGANRLWYNQRVAAGLLPSTESRSVFESIMNQYNVCKSESDGRHTSCKISLDRLVHSAFNQGQFRLQQRVPVNTTRVTGVDPNTNVVTINESDLAIMPLLFDKELMLANFRAQHEFAQRHRTSEELNASLETTCKLIDEKFNFDTRLTLAHSMALVPSKNYKGSTVFTNTHDWLGLRTHHDGEVSTRFDIPHIGAGITDSDIEKVSGMYSGFHHQLAKDSLHLLRTMYSRSNGSKWDWYKNALLINGVAPIKPKTDLIRSVDTYNGVVEVHHSTTKVDIAVRDAIQVAEFGITHRATKLNALVKITSVVFRSTNTYTDVEGCFDTEFMNAHFSRRLLSQTVTVQLGYGTDAKYDPDTAPVMLKLSTGSLGNTLKDGLWLNKDFTPDNIGAIMHCIGDGMGLSCAVKRGGDCHFFGHRSHTANNASSTHLHVNLASCLNKSMIYQKKEPPYFQVAVKPNFPIANTATFQLPVAAKEAKEGESDDEEESQPAAGTSESQFMLNVTLSILKNAVRKKGPATNNMTHELSTFLYSDVHSGYLAFGHSQLRCIQNGSVSNVTVVVALARDIHNASFNVWKPDIQSGTGYTPHAISNSALSAEMDPWRRMNPLAACWSPLSGASDLDINEIMRLSKLESKFDPDE